MLRSGPAALGWSAAARCADRKMRAPPRSGARLAICGWARRAFKRDLDAVGGGGQELRRFTLNRAGFTIPPDSLGLARVCPAQMSRKGLASSRSSAHVPRPPMLDVQCHPRARVVGGEAGTGTLADTHLSIPPAAESLRPLSCPRSSDPPRLPAPLHRPSANSHVARPVRAGLPLRRASWVIPGAWGAICDQIRDHLQVPWRLSEAAAAARRRRHGDTTAAR